MKLSLTTRLGERAVARQTVPDEATRVQREMSVDLLRARSLGTAEQTLELDRARDAPASTRARKVPSSRRA